MVDNYRPTHYLGLCMLSAAQQLYGTATSHSSSSPSCSSSLFCLCLSVLLPSIPPAIVFALPEAFLFHFASLCLHLSPCILSPPAPAPSCSICLSVRLSVYWCAIILFLGLKCVCFLSCCSGPTDSTSLTTRARAALNSSSRPKSWKRSGWSSLAWPCECVCLWVCALMRDSVISLSCLLSQHQSAHISHPVIQVKLLEDLWGTWDSDKKMCRYVAHLLFKPGPDWKCTKMQ